MVGWEKVLANAKNEHVWFADHACIRYNRFNSLLSQIISDHKVGIDTRRKQEIWEEEIEKNFREVVLFLENKKDRVRKEIAILKDHDPHQDTPETEMTTLLPKGSIRRRKSHEPARELLQEVKLLKKYQYLNMTGFKKMVKKYNKETIEKRNLKEVAKYNVKTHRMEDGVQVSPEDYLTEQQDIMFKEMKASVRDACGSDLEEALEAEYQSNDQEPFAWGSGSRWLRGRIAKHKAVVASVVGLLLLVLLMLAFRPNFKPDSPQDNWKAHIVVYGLYISFCLIIFHSPSEIVMTGFGVILVAMQIIDYTQMFVGFSNIGVLANGVLLVVAKGLSNTGGVERIVQFFIGRTGRNIALVQIRVLTFVALLSTCLNNTPIGAMMVPIMESWCSRNGLSVSHFLMPISFAIMLGGMCTIVGSSANLATIGIAQQLVSQPSRTVVPFTPPGFFMPAVVGIPVSVAGILYMIIAARFRACLPIRKEIAQFGMAGAQNAYFKSTVIHVVPFSVDGHLIGKTIGKAHLLRLPAKLDSVLNSTETIDNKSLEAHVLSKWDVLVFKGDIQAIVSCLNVKGLYFQSRQFGKVSGQDYTRRIVEVKLGDALQGKSVRESEFRKLYNAAVVGIAGFEIDSFDQESTTDLEEGNNNYGTTASTIGPRGSLQRFLHYGKKFGDYILKEGDTLLIVTQLRETGKELGQANKTFTSIGVVDFKLPVRTSLKQQAQMIGSLLGLLLIIVGTASQLFDVVTVSLLISLAFIAFGIVPYAEVWPSIKGPMLLLIAASFSISEAIRSTGLANWGAVVVTTVSGGSLTAAMTVLFMLTFLIGMFINNAVTAVLVFPIAYEAVKVLNVSATPMVYLIIVASSASFFTPISYQTNQMVWEPGGYKFADFMVYGGGLQIVVAATCVPLISFYYSIGLLV